MEFKTQSNEDKTSFVTGGAPSLWKPWLRLTSVTLRFAWLPETVYLCYICADIEHMDQKSSWLLLRHSCRHFFLQLLSSPEHQLHICTFASVGQVCADTISCRLDVGSMFRLSTPPTEPQFQPVRHTGRAQSETLMFLNHPFIFLTFIIKYPQSFSQ